MCLCILKHAFMIIFGCTESSLLRTWAFSSCGKRGLLPRYVGCHGSRDIIDAQGCWGLVASWLNWFLGGDESMVKVDPGA